MALRGEPTILARKVYTTVFGINPDCCEQLVGSTLMKVKHLLAP